MAARRLLTAVNVAVLATVQSAAVPISPALAAPGPSFTNPVIGTPNSADPSIVYTNGNCNYLATTWSSAIVRSDPTDPNRQPRAAQPAAVKLFFPEQLHASAL